MPDLVLLDGSTFFVGERSGDAEADESEGLFVADVRHLSLWRLLLDGEPIRPLTSHKTDYYAVSIFGTSGRARVGSNSPISVRRDRTVVNGLHEDVTVENHSEEELRFPVEVQFDADFADIFEVKHRRGKRWDARVGVDRARVDLWY